MKSKTIILGITGSIAAYKAADIASQLVKKGCVVHAVLTSDGAHFITPLTLKTLTRNPVITSLYDEELGNRPTHIELADSASLVLVAPATANILAKMAHGITDDALTAILLATRAPILAAPAMNGKMWDHPATVDNVALLKKRGVKFIGPQKGMLACGYEGLGRLWETDGIVKEAVSLI
jgi:phosphopantothenoylcysteine decarboxylase